LIQGTGRGFVPAIERPRASEYAPGHKMQNATKSTAPGASEYAPGHQTTGSNTKKRY